MSVVPALPPSMPSSPFSCRSAGRPALAALLAVAAACGGEKPTGTPEPAVGRVQIARAGGDSLLAGEARPLAAAVTATTGAALPGAAVRWQSLAPSVLRVDDAGVVTGVAEGIGTVTASVAVAGGVRADTLALRVLPPVASVALLPMALHLRAGAWAAVEPTLRSPAGAVVTGRALAWRSSDTTVVRVTAGGQVQGVGAGSATLVATTGGLAGATATASVPVAVEAPPTAALDIATRFATTPPPEMGAVVATAIARWQAVLPGHLEPVRVALPAGACMSGTPAIDEVVQDLLVLVRLDSIDGPGKVLGQAGPCAVRSLGTRLPVIGAVTLDTADLRRMIDAGTASSVVAHELGHVLGVGTLWNFGGQMRRDDTDVTNYRYVGAGARQAQAELGFSPDAGLPVPVESFPSGCTAATLASDPVCAALRGTAGAHWRASNWGLELMTGWARPTMYLSALTVASLADLGYPTSQAGAEWASLALLRGQSYAGLRATLLPDEAMPIRDQALLPRWAVGPGGQAVPLR